MADIKFTDLTILTPMLETDILPIVSNPGGTPISKKVTLKTILDTRLNYSIISTGDFALATAIGVQSAFSTSGDVFTLAATTTYEFEGMYQISKSGATCTIALAFALGGGASITSILYDAIAQSIAVDVTGTSRDSIYIDTTASTVINATSITAVFIKFRGLIRMNAGGTVTPQVNFSASPTGPIMKANSWIKFTPIGTNTENQKGVVA